MKNDDRKTALEKARADIAARYENGKPVYPFIQGKTPEQVVAFLEGLTNWANSLRDNIREWPDGMPEAALDRITFEVPGNKEALEKGMAEMDRRGVTTRSLIGLLINLLLNEREIRKEGDRYFVNQ